MFHSDVCVFHSRGSESIVLLVIDVGRLEMYVGSGC